MSEWDLIVQDLHPLVYVEVLYTNGYEILKKKFNAYEYAKPFIEKLQRTGHYPDSPFKLIEVRDVKQSIIYKA